MLDKILATTDDIGPFIVRVTLGAAMFPHGAQKLLGWFGGGGFQGTMQFFTENMGIPFVFALLAIVAEFFGALGLIVGFLGRISALGVGAVMVVAALMESGNGFFMNWSGDKAGEGIEYHFLAIAMALVVIIKGSGAWSIDRAWSRRL